MSKKRPTSETGISGKVPRFAAWALFIGGVIELAYLLIGKPAYDRINITLLIFLLVNGGACYILSTYLEKNPLDANAIFKDWTLGLLIVNIVMVGGIAAYIL